MREAKTKTSWTDPDENYEAAALAFTQTVLGDAELTADIAGFVSGIAPDAEANSLGAKLVQLTMPGVPDVYQGCELAGLALVDPDNRQLVDYGRRRALLTRLDGGGRGEGAGAERGGGTSRARGWDKHHNGYPGVDLDTGKLLVTSRALRLRRDHPGWFAGDYAPLRAAGPAARHAVAFCRGGHAVTVATRLPAALRQRGGWAGTALEVPGTRWRDVLSGAIHTGPRLLLSEVTERLPVALLVPDGESVPGAAR